MIFLGCSSLQTAHTSEASGLAKQITKRLHGPKGVQMQWSTPPYTQQMPEIVAAPAGGPSTPDEVLSPSCDLPHSAHWRRISHMPAP